MHLNRLSLRNFKKYRRAEIKFQDGLTGIVGSNGVGKSTIVEAIAWALYGNKASAIKRELIKNSNAGETDSVEVSLSLDHGRQEMTITRAMRGKGLVPEASISLDGRRVAMGSREVDQRLEEILQIGYQDFMRTFYARQKDLDNLLKEGGAGKREYLLKLLGLDEIRERSAERLKSDLRGLEDRKNRLDGALGEMGDVEVKIEETSKSIALAKAELSGCRGMEARLAADAERIKLETDIWTDKQHKHDLTTQRISSIESKVAEKKRAMDSDEARLREIDGAKMILLELEPRLLLLEALKDRLEGLEPKRKEHDLLLQRRIKAKTELDMAGQALADDEKRLDALIRDRSDLDKIRPLQVLYRGTLECYERLEGLKDRHAELQTLLKEEKIRLDSIDDRIKRVEDALRIIILARENMEEIAPLKKRCEELQSEYVSAGRKRELQKELDLLNARRSILEDRLDAIKARTHATKKDIESIGDPAVREAELKRHDLELDGLGDELNRGLAELRSEHKVEEAKRSEALQNLIKIRGLGEDSRCPTCERSLGEQYTKLVERYELAVKAAGDRESALKREIKLQMERIEGVASARSGLKAAFDDLNAKKSRRAELFATLRGLQSQIVEASPELEGIFKAIEKIGEVAFDPERFAKLEAEIGELLPHVEEYRRLAIRLEEQPKRQAELDELKKQRQILNERMEDLGRKIKALGYVESEYVSCKGRLADLKPANESFAILSQRVQEIPVVEDKVRRARSQIQALRVVVDGIDKAVVELGFDPALHDGLMKERQSLAKDEQRAQAIRLKTAYEPEIRERLQEASNDLAGLETEMGEAKRQLSALRYDAALHEKSKTTLAKAEIDLDAVRKDVSNKEIRLGVLEGDHQRLEGDAVRKREYERDLAQTLRWMQVVDVTKGVVNRFMDHILIRIRDEIAVTAGEILEEVSGRYSLLKIDDDFNILVEDRGDYYPIQRYSGGETDMIAVSVRVAISEYLMRFGPEGEGYSFLILDEIFGSQDMEHRENMINMLRSLQERFPQIIAISHISDVQGQFDNTITVIEDELGNSRVEVN